jgi:hypothetical protein
MRLFRQEKCGAWEPVIARVVAALTRLIGLFISRYEFA